jgi:outer membrane lipoprotein carrier protein
MDCKQYIARLISLLALGSFHIAPDAEAQVKAFECKAGEELTSSQAKDLLAKVQIHYSGLDALHGEFQQDSYVAALDEQESSAGEMWFGKPGKMRWVYASPREQIVVINQGTLWLYQPDKQQVLIDDIGKVLLSSLPVSFMMGIGNVTRDFELKGACHGLEGVILRLVPKRAEEKSDSGDALEGFDLLVDNAQSLPKGAKISSLGGNVTAIIFKNLTSQGVRADSRRFVLEYPKGVDIMDRRLSP